MASAAFLMAACQSDDEQNGTVDNGNLATVKFEFDAGAINHEVSTPSTRAYTVPAYDVANFSIYAFRLVGTEYQFEKEISTTNMSYSISDKMLIGTDKLTIGTYKFLPVYGLKKQTNVLTVPTWTGAPNDNALITYKGNGALGEIFMRTGSDVASLKTYVLGTTDAQNEIVKDTLRRAVSRVDVMFISADKVNGQYVEKVYPGANNILDGKTIDNFELRFTNYNNKMNFFGDKIASANAPLTVSLGNFGSTMAIGTGTKTELGSAGYAKYDNIDPADIISGSAHFFGTYMIPNATTTSNVGLQLFIKPVGGDGRTINVNYGTDNLIPLERNKITIVKVYVLKGNNVFSTEVEFEVKIDTVWEDANTATGEIK